MNKLTAKYIFRCKLRGEPVKIHTDKLTKKELKLLAKHGVWKLDPLLSSNFWSEYHFKIEYRVWLIDSDGQGTSLFPGDRHEVLL